MPISTSKIILYAEDDLDDKDLFMNTATDLDSAIQVIHSPNGLELLKQLEAFKSDALPCAIVLDVNMPVMDGIDTLKHIKENERWSSIPIVIYTTSPRTVHYELETKYNILIKKKPDNFGGIKESIQTILSYCKIL